MLVRHFRWIFLKQDKKLGNTDKGKAGNRRPTAQKKCMMRLKTDCGLKSKHNRHDTLSVRGQNVNKKTRGGRSHATWRHDREVFMEQKSGFARNYRQYFCAHVRKRVGMLKPLDPLGEIGLFFFNFHLHRVV